MIHTYRDPRVLERRANWRVNSGNVIAVGFLVAVLLYALRDPVVWREWKGGAVAVALTIGLAWFSGRRHDRAVCGEIRLDDSAGTCELDRAGGVIRLHVNQITAIEYERDGDSMSEYYVCLPDRKIPIEKGMTDFAYFLERLRSLNPDVDLSSVPSKLRGSFLNTGAG